MDIGLYQSASALDGLQQYQNIISSNIAASHVAGYKRTEISFEAIQAGEMSAPNSDKIHGSIPASFASIRGQLNFSQGEIRQTNNPMDFALSGDGFMVVENPADEQVKYTRNGHFYISPEGTIVDSQGWELQGEAGSIKTNPTAGPVTVDVNGQLFQGETSIDAFKMVAFETPHEKLTKAEGGFFIKEEGEEGEKATEVKVMQGFLEQGNAKPIREMVDMIRVSRAYEMNRKVIQELDGMMGRAISTLGQTR